MGIRVFAPASVGNVICGFDVLGLALDKPGDEIIARLSDKPGIHIKTIHGDPNRKLSHNPIENCAGAAALAVLDMAIKKGVVSSSFGVEMELFKKIPLGSGLGSSSSSAVAAAMAVNLLLPEAFEKRDLLQPALVGETIAAGMHADNIAPSLLGGIMFVKETNPIEVYRLPVVHGLYATVVHPHIEVLTKDARAILSTEINLRNYVEQSTHIGGFIIGMYTGNLGLIASSLQDVIIEPQRAALIPGFYDIKNAALQAGAMACGISGAGPSVFALSANSLAAENAGEAMQKVFRDQRIHSDLIISPINHEGAVLY